MTWKIDERTRKAFGRYSLVSETNADRETGHLIDLGTKRIRVLPDEAHSGLKRAKVSTEAVKSAAALVGVSEPLVEACVLGTLAKAGLEWEIASDDQTFEEWLVAWHWVWGDDPAKTLISDMERAGWKVSR